MKSDTVTTRDLLEAWREAVRAAALAERLAANAVKAAEEADERSVAPEEACEAREIAEGMGYVLKDRVSQVAELADAVRRVGDGGTVLDPIVVSQLVGRPRAGSDPLDELTEREREVLALMAEGRSNAAHCAAPVHHRAHRREARDGHLRQVNAAGKHR